MDTADYMGQRYVEQLLKIVNKKAFINNEDDFLEPFFSIFESSLEQGVEDESTIQWDDRCHYTRISWTGYSWKLPQEIKRRLVQIDISKLGGGNPVGQIRIPLRKIADDGGDIQISSRIMSKTKLRNGDPISVKIQFCDRAQ